MSTITRKSASRIPVFTTITDIVEKQRRQLFEILENDDYSSNFFIAKCDEFGVDITINARDKREGYEGRTLLHSSASLGLIHAVSYLIHRGADVNVLDSSISSLTPLLESVAANNLDIANLLVNNNADIQMQDRNGENALHYAARNGNARMVKMLLQVSRLSTEQIQQCASVTNIKLKFPEDLSKNALCKEVLVDYRVYGAHTRVARKTRKAPSSREKN